MNWGTQMKTLLAMLSCVLLLASCDGSSSGTSADQIAGKKVVLAQAGPPSAPLPQTGQTICYDEAGTTVSCFGTGQDGERQAGVAWPSPRFTDNGDQSIKDNLTGLIWTKDADLMKTRDPSFNAAYDGAGIPITVIGATWQLALDYVKKLNTENYLGHNDWRLPNINELASLVNSGQNNPATWLNTQGFSNVQSARYWSSTSSASHSIAWTLSMDTGDLSGGYGKTNTGPFVWPVRSGQSGALGSVTLAKTGQTACYNANGSLISCSGTGQDGELQVGASWPTPRFTDNTTITSTDNTITDNLTGLIWSKNANLPAAPKSWLDALDYIKTLNSMNYLGHTDWRLPNRIELESLANKGLGNFDNTSWLNGQGFSNILYSYSSGGYWSSTTYVQPSNYQSNHSWEIDMFGSYSRTDFKISNGYVWPVRGGQTGSSASWTLSVLKSSTGSGTVTSSTGGISCGSTCSAIITPGSSVTLTATANNGSTFAGWSGSCSGTGVCIVTMDAGKSVTAAFTIATSTTTLTKSKVFMAAGDDIFNVNTSGTTVYGNTGNDVVTIANGVTDVFLDQNIERINFSAVSSNYTFMQTGNMINIYNNYLLVRTPVQDDTDGTLLSFSDGIAPTLLESGGVMKLGGAIVSSSAATTLNPVLR